MAHGVIVDIGVIFFSNTGNVIAIGGDTGENRHAR